MNGLKHWEYRWNKWDWEIHVKSISRHTRLWPRFINSHVVHSFFSFFYLIKQLLSFAEGIASIGFPDSTRNSEESAICAMLKENMPDFPLYQLSCILFFLIPMVFIAVLYVRIGLRIQSDSLAQNVEGYVHGETKQAQSRKTITRMLSKCLVLNECYSSLCS